MTKRMINVAILAIAFVVTSCSSDDNAPTTKSFSMNINGLEDLGTDFVYEGWLIVNGQPVSTGTFTSTSNAQTFSVDSKQLASATKFVLSIEPAGETGTEAATPADTKLLVGDFAGDEANLSINTVADFSGSNYEGTFFLRSPTDEPSGTGNNRNDENGIWFGSPGAPPTPAFDLPTLEAGWKYEGWVVVDGVGPLTTGTFEAFDIADENAGATSSFSGTENAGPPIPGEDFFNNAPAGATFPIDIRGRTVVISIEPSPDNSPTPFLLKPLVGSAGNDTAPTEYDLNFDNSSFPSGKISR